MSVPERHLATSLAAPPLDLGRMVGRAARWLLGGFVFTLMLVFAGTYLLVGVGEEGPGLTTILVRSATIAGIAGIVLFVAQFLWQSPSLLARVFAVAAFGATFFGLSMLVVFFVRLGMQAGNWFEVMPPRLEARNKEAVARVGSEEQARKMKLFLARLEAATQAAANEKSERLQAATTPHMEAEIEADAEKALLLKLSEAALKARAETPADAVSAAQPAAKDPAAPASDIPDFAERELQERIEEPLKAELKVATTPQEKAAIEKDWTELRGAKVRDLIPSLKENVLIFEKDYVKDTSALSLLWRFFTGLPSHDPADAGIMPALLGSIYLGLITVLCAVPLGVGTAVYLEEYKRTHHWFWERFFYVLQTNINNLAGIPSVVYGIFGALVFVEYIFKPLANIHAGIEARNSLGGGLTLALLTLPVVIVSAQEAIRAVPMSLRHGALALGATKWQVIRHLVLPNALPGIMTGTILSMSRALGEAAPLVFFGALLYKPDPPSLFSDFTVLPMQIFGWTCKPEEVWLDNAAMASFVLLLTVLTLNGLAIYLRQRAVKRTKW